MAMVVDLSKYFTALKIAKRFDKAPPIKTTIFDEYFPESVRDQYALPVIPVQEISSIVQAVPVVRRGAASIPLGGDAFDNIYIEPLPVRVHANVSAKELNDLKLLGELSKEKWATRKQMGMRKTVRLVNEILASQALFDGKIEYPLLQSNGSYAVYTVTYNGGQSILGVNVAATSKWDAAECTLVKVYELLEEMSTALDEGSHGGEKKVEAGKTAYSALLALIEGTDKPKVPVKINNDGTITLGGHIIRKMAEAYRHPKTGATVNKITPGEIRMISKGYTGHFYAAVDDLDANLQAEPMFVKPVKTEDPSGYRLVAESKPLPVVAPQATCKAIVVNP
jgi:hypothetical protein